MAVFSVLHLQKLAVHQFTKFPVLARAGGRGTAQLKAEAFTWIVELGGGQSSVSWS